MKKLVYIIFLGFTSFVFSQNKISGVVADKNNEALFGVQIYIEQLHIGTTTNEDGSFSLERIPNGEHQLVFSFLGFERLKKNIIFPGIPNEINVIMTESVFHMDEVIVSSPFHKIQSENVMKVEYKSIQSLQKNGEATLIQGITSIPGVEQLSTGTGIGKPVIRGLTGNRVLVYAQGVRLENQQFGSEHGLGLNEAGIESIEVIKGPASLLYGSDALGGVLYFNPEKFALANETNVNISQKFFSNTLGSNTSVGVKSSGDQFKFLVRGTYNTHSDYQIPDGDRVTNTRFYEKDFKAGLGLHLDNFITEFRYNFNQSKIGITEGVEDQTTKKDPALPYQDLDNHIFSLHNHIYLNNSKFDVDLGYIINIRKEFEDEHEDEHDHDDIEEESEESHDPAIHLNLKTFTYDLKYHLPKWKKFENIIGVQGMLQTNTNYGEEILIPNAKTNDIGLFITSLYSWNEINSLQGGIRFDNRNLQTEEHQIAHEDEIHVFNAIDRSFHNFTASLGFKTELFSNIITRINLASGFRAPNLAELTSNGIHHGTNRFEIGNPDLNSEQNFQSDISLEYKTKHFEIFANGFYNKINDYIFISPTGEVEDGFDVFSYIQEDAKLYGGEFGFHFHPHPVDWLHLESSFETVTGKQSNDEYLPLIPANKITNTIRSEFKGSKKWSDWFLSLKLQSYFKQDNVSFFEEKTDGYNLLDFGLGGNLNFNKVKTSFHFNVNNMFDKNYISHMSALKVDDIPNIGRNFILGITLRI